jgi:2-phospho-L-lactate guanylyltransferase
MQGSVHEFDTTTGAGAVLLDDGRRVPFDAEAFAGSGLRLLRIGQRLTLELDPRPESPKVLSLRLNGV